MSARPRLASFGYHEVTDDPRASGFQRPGALPYKHTTRAFAQHLARIAAAGVAPELVTDVDLTCAGRHLFLTFDDGGRSALAICDELNRRGWKAHFFIVTSLIGDRTFLDAAEVRYIASCGHLVGSHSHHHPDIFCELPFARMVEEWRVSCDLLADLLGRPCHTASVPGGDISTLVLRSAGAAGLAQLFTSEPRLQPLRVDGCWIVGRFITKVDTTAARVGDLARFRGWTRALLARRFKVYARTLLPGAYRRHIQRSTQPLPPVADA